MAFPRPASTGSITVRDLARFVDNEPEADTLETGVTGVTLDSRAVRPGDVYAALPGARMHGADFAASAADAGAVAVLTDPAGAERAREAGVALPLLITDDPRSVLGLLAAQIYGTDELTLALIGITGTNGKTTTAYLVSSALEALGRSVGLIGTVETRIGAERIKSVRTTPESPDLHALLAVMGEQAIDACVMEVSSHALAQHRVDGVVYDLALFTNLSQDHLDFHGRMENYFEAKAQLFTRARSRRGLICVDDSWGRTLAQTCEVPVQTLTTHPDVVADWTVTPSATDPARFVLDGPGGLSLSLVSALPGVFNVANTAMAAAACFLLGVAPSDVERAILTDPHVPGRMERVSPTVAGPAPLAVVDYAHTPDAVAAALAALRPNTSGALIVVLGAGGDRDKGKREAMGEAAARGADIVVVTDDNPRSEVPSEIRAQVLAGAHRASSGAQILEIEGRHTAIVRAVELAAASGPGAAIAVVGKGHEVGQDIGGEIHPFDDRDEVRAALDALCGHAAMPTDEAGAS